MIIGLTGIVGGGNLSMPMMAGSSPLDSLPELTYELFLAWLYYPEARAPQRLRPLPTGQWERLRPAASPPRQRRQHPGPEDGAEVLTSAIGLCDVSGPLSGVRVLQLVGSGPF